MTSMQRVGAACIYLDPDGTRPAALNFSGTTVKALSGMSALDRTRRLLPLLTHNLEALCQQVTAIAGLPTELRMWRISSDLLPIPTHEITSNFYEDRYVRSLIEHRLRKVGELARKHGVRLSFHPAQYVVLGSQNEDIRERSIRELSLYAFLFDTMGYTDRHQDGCAINVHVGPKDAAVPEMRKLITRTPDVARFLTLENDEFSWSARNIVDNFGDMVPVVLDIHHYWIMHGRRIHPSSRLVTDIHTTWHGVRPKIHHALSAQTLCGPSRKRRGPVLSELLDAGATRSALRAHSTEAWDLWSNRYALSFVGSDVMWEGKNKNLGAAQVLASK